ncbi:MAG: vitamin K epoxide reductase family protein [Acidobacteria bacterium]|nr:vitamin K epoxide reductase family protein [Acidobacteriota bacterium]
MSSIPPHHVGVAGHRRLMSAIIVLAVVGVLVSSLSLYEHFATSKSSFCDIGESFNCDLVNRSPYSILLGVPVALIGGLGYFLVLVLATVYRHATESPFLLLIAALVGLSFALYLTYIEAHVLTVWCLLCLASLAVILGITVLSAFIALGAKPKSQTIRD